MAQSIVHSHSFQLFEDLQMSANEFYALVETMVREYKYPDVSCKRKTLKEAGLFSLSREYLCITQGDSNYFVCACPFGRSFFISWWLKEQEDALSAAISKIPGFGLLTGKSRAKTFFEFDTQLMFTESINAIIKIAVQKVMTDKGYRQPNMVMIESA